jgi:uncharacterized Ntn-hydrolase superfamily protein
MSFHIATFSIVAAGPDGQLGLASTSKVLAVGGRCPYVVPGLVAISSQAYADPHLSTAIERGLGEGLDLQTAFERALAADPAREWRQLLAIAADGTSAVHTGAETDPWAGHRHGRSCVAAGNLLTGQATVDAMVETFEADDSPALGERLLLALEAGQAAGGDRRGRQSAVLLVHGPLEPPYIDLRVDDHPDPVAELRRLWSFMTPEVLSRAWRVASTREGEPVEAIKYRQALVREQLQRQERS